MVATLRKTEAFTAEAQRKAGEIRFASSQGAENAPALALLVSAVWDCAGCGLGLQS
jgi:hypothetical protein